MREAEVLDATQLQAMIERCPFHRWLGLRVAAATENGVEVSAPWRAELMSNPDARTMHGGILATLIDLTADLAIGMRLGRTLPTIDLRVDYHRPAVECDVRILGRVVKLGSTIATAEAWIYDPHGNLVASGRGTFLAKRSA